MPPDIDPQREAVYAAGHKTFPNERELSLGELQSVVDEIMASAWWNRLYPKAPKFRVRDGRGMNDARIGRDGKSLQHPPGTRHRYLVVHEMAHGIDPTGTEDHGAVFSALYLFLVGECYSPTAKRRLAKWYTRFGVTWDRRIAATGRP